MASATSASASSQFFEASKVSQAAKVNLCRRNSAAGGSLAALVAAVVPAYLGKASQAADNASSAWEVSAAVTVPISSAGLAGLKLLIHRA